jgi:hypothetical protein
MVGSTRTYQWLVDNRGSLRSIRRSKLRSSPGEAVRRVFGKSYNLEKVLNVIKMFGGIEHMLDALAERPLEIAACAK